MTAVRPARPGRAVVHLDGEPWRTLPLEALLRAGIAEGDELDRERLRVLRREVRRLEAVSAEEVAVLADELLAPGRLSAAGIGPDEGCFRDAVARVSPGLLSTAA